MKLNRRLRGWGRVFAIALLIGTIWMFSLPTFWASASPYTPSDNMTKPTAKDASVAAESKQRITGVEYCRKYLINGDKNTTATLDRPLDKSGSDKLVGALKVSNNPEPTVAEVEFKRCLEQQGIAPEP
jgi:hypothetical protein